MTNIWFKIFISIIPFFIANVKKTASDQDSANQQNKPLFTEGIFIENLHLTVPWSMRADEIANYGNPHLLKKSKKVLSVKWDSVRILQGTSISLRYNAYTHKCTNCSNFNRKVIIVQGPIDTKDASRLRTYFDEYSGMPGKLVTHARNYFYSWEINECSIVILYTKKFGCLLELRKEI